MAIFEVQDSDGSIYEIEASSENAALSAFQTYLADKGLDTAPPEKLGATSGAFRTFMDGAAFGFGDNATAHEAAILGRTPKGDWFDYSKPYNDRYERALRAERRQNNQFYEDHPVVANTANIAGAVAVPFGAAKAGATLLKGGMSVGKATGRGALEGAAYGAAHGAGNADGQNVGRSALAGGVLGGAIGGSLSGLGQLRANHIANQGRQAFHGVEALESAKDAAYRKVDDAGVKYTPEAMGDLLARITGTMQAKKMHPLRHPKASSMLEDLEHLRNSPQSLTELDQMRQVVRRDVAKAADEGEKSLGNKMIRRIDEFIETAGDKQIAQGSAPGAAQAIKNARNLHGRLARYEAVAQAVDLAKLRASSTNSGNNTANAVSQNIRRELERSLKGKAYYNPSEQGLMRQIVDGTRAQQFARGTAKALGGGLSTLGAIGLRSPELLLSKGVGKGAQLVDEGLTHAGVTNLLEHILQGGPKKTAAQPAGLNALQKLVIQKVTKREPTR